MSFFGNLWSGVKRIGKSVGHSVRKIGKSISNIGRPVLRTISKGYNFVKHIPVVGQMVSNSPVGTAIEKGLDIGDKVLNVADKAGSGDYLGAGRAAANATGLRI